MLDVRALTVDDAYVEAADIQWEGELLEEGEKAQMKILNEVRKEDDLYYTGAFWIVADSFSDIIKGNFRIVGNKILTDYNGEIKQAIISKRSLSHKALWSSKFKEELKSDKDYDYYPRGRVGLINGKAYININWHCNMPKIIDAVLDMYRV